MHIVHGLLVALSVTVCAAGCASAPVPPVEQTSRTYSARLAETRAVISSGELSAQAAVKGAIVLGAAGDLHQLSLMVAPVRLGEESTGLITIHAKAPVEPSAAGASINLAFDAEVNTAVTNARLGLKRDSLFCSGGPNAGKPCSSNSECGEGAGAPGGICTTDAHAGRFVACAGNITASREADNSMTGRLVVTCEKNEWVGFRTLEIDLHFVSEIFDVLFGEKQAAGPCPDGHAQVIAKDVCIQPVVIADADGSNPTSCPSFDDAVAIWKKCCITLTIRAPRTVRNPAYKTLDESPTNDPTAAERALFAADNDDNGVGGCIEVYCPSQFSQGGNAGKDISGGGASYNGGTAAAKVVVVEGATGTLPAHEIGHALGASHDDVSVMKPTGRHDAEGPHLLTPDPCRAAQGSELAELSNPRRACCQTCDPMP